MNTCLQLNTNYLHDDGTKATLENPVENTENLNSLLKHIALSSFVYYPQIFKITDKMNEYIDKKLMKGYLKDLTYLLDMKILSQAVIEQNVVRFTPYASH